MPKPHVHAAYDVKKYGGKEEDYVAIHDLMDSTKETFSSNCHRCLTHNIWFVHKILPRVFGDTIVNSDGKRVSVKDIGENHCLLDFRHKFIPTVQDWLENITAKPWMNNAMGTDLPNSAKHLYRRSGAEEGISTPEPDEIAEAARSYIKD